MQDPQVFLAVFRCVRKLKGHRYLPGGFDLLSAGQDLDIEEPGILVIRNNDLSGLFPVFRTHDPADRPLQVFRVALIAGQQFLYAQFRACRDPGVRVVIQGNPVIVPRSGPVIHHYGIGEGIDGEAVRIKGDGVSFHHGVGNLFRGDPVFRGQGLYFGLFFRGSNQFLGNVFCEVHHMEFFPGFGIGQPDADVHRNQRFNLLSVHKDGDVVQARQAYVIRSQGGGSLLPVGFPQVAARRDFLHQQFRVFRNPGFRPVGHVDFIGVAVRGQDLLGNLRPLNHTEHGETVRSEGYGINHFAVSLCGALIGICFGFNDLCFVVFDMNRMDVMVVRQFDDVLKDNLYIHIRLGFQFPASADEGDVKEPLQGDFAPLFRQCFLGHAAVQGIFRRAGADFPDFHLRIRRETGFRSVGRCHHIIRGSGFQSHGTDLHLLGNDIAERLQPVAFHRQDFVFCFKDPAILPGQGAKSPLRPVHALTGQGNAGLRLDGIAFRIRKVHQPESVPFLSHLVLPDFVLFIPHQFIGGLQSGIQIRAFGSGYSQDRVLRNAGFRRIINLNVDPVRFCVQGTCFIDDFRYGFGRVFRFTVFRFGSFFQGFFLSCFFRVPLRIFFRCIIRFRLPIGSRRFFRPEYRHRHGNGIHSGIVLGKGGTGGGKQQHKSGEDGN